MKVASLWRHPIKSHGAESMNSVAVTEGRALPFDRCWAVAHEAAKLPENGWASCQNFSRGAKAPGLMAIGAKTDESTGRVTLTHPDLGTLELDPDNEGPRLVDWAGGLIPEGRAQSARVVRADSQAWTDSPFPSISLASTASLDALSERLGQALDPRRFRINIWIDGIAPFAEFDWVGREVEIGGVRFRAEEPITRCLATAANPQTGLRDADTLGALERGWGHQDLGIYLTALTSGPIALGDEVVL
jgi:uncharacterized protein YcbX